MANEQRIKVNNYTKAAPEYITVKKESMAKKMKHSWEDFGKTGKAIGKSVKRHVKKAGLAF